MIDAGRPTCRHLAPLFMAAAALLAGCAGTTPTVRSAVEVPSAWSASAASAAPSSDPARAWWTGLGPVELDRLVGTALHANRNLTVARARVRQAQALVDQAAADRVPSLGLQAAASSGRSSPLEPKSRITSAGFQARWEADLFGARSLDIAATRLDAQSNQALQAAAEVVVAAEVVTAYVEAASLQDRIVVFDRDIELLRRLAEVTTKLFTAGTATRFDIDRAQSTLQAARAQRIDLLGQRRVREHRLAALLGQPPQRLQLDSTGLAGLQPLPPTLSLPAEVLARRPDVQAKALALQAASARLGVAMRNRLPKITLGWDAGLARLSVLGAPGDRGPVSSLAIGLSLPLFDGGRARADVDANEAHVDAALAEYEQAVLVALVDVELALTLRASAELSLVSAQDALVASDSATAAAERLYRAGRSDITALLAAQRAGLQAAESVLSARQALLLGSVAVHRAAAGALPAAARSELPAVQPKVLSAGDT